MPEGDGGHAERAPEPAPEPDSAPEHESGSGTERESGSRTDGRPEPDGPLDGEPADRRTRRGGRPSRTRRSGRTLHRVGAGAVVLAWVLAAAAYQFDLGPRWFGFDYPSPVTEPAQVAPPPGLDLPAAADVEPVAADVESADASPAAVRRLVKPLLRNKKLGPDVAVAVMQLSDGEVVFREGARRVIPASTMKLLTTSAALERLGGDARFRTTVVADPKRRSITLVGGGDPFLERTPPAAGETYPARADIQTLARGTARALRDFGRTRVRLRYDASLFEGPALSPAWEPNYLPDNVVSPISALWVDEGRQADSYVPSPDPARAAADAFANALEKHKIEVRGAPRLKTADEEDEEIAAVQSAPLAQIVQRVLDVSDNEAAEVLARHVAIAADRPATFADGAAAVLDTLEELGVDTSGVRTFDGSGLSRQDRLTPELLVQLIATDASEDHPELRPVLAGLPVAGFTGSLAIRFDTGDPEGLGVVRAKTGTLRGVHGLAGTTVTEDGVELGFVAIADRVKVENTLAARVAIDELAAALAGCTCAE